ncbi:MULTISPECIES: cyclophilin-like fold protein [unclassified Sphingobacterium]|uniref:cyclophilin-like fold protein n=1 Tax=unclassified Sphingobacterium TaxID=2609468 RepID=UPI0025D9E78A|nr:MULTISPECIES: cyclophilin-like fold protein [unclassified Sphingobacterium]
MKSAFLIPLLFLSIVSSVSACVVDNSSQDDQRDSINRSKGSMETIDIKIKVGSKTFNCTLLDNKAAWSFSEMLPLTIKMTELNGNEKYFDLPKSLPTNSSNPGSIKNGDLMLYGSRTLVLFYEGFSTSYSYTKLGAINAPSGLASALGAGNVTVTFEKK